MPSVPRMIRFPEDWLPVLDDEAAKAGQTLLIEKCLGSLSIYEE